MVKEVLFELEHEGGEEASRADNWGVALQIDRRANIWVLRQQHAGAGRSEELAWNQW